jgi:hypothetical protein
MQKLLAAVGLVALMLGIDHYYYDGRYFGAATEIMHKIQVSF